MKNDEESYFLFIKIGEEKHIDSLQKSGQIFCNSITYFRSIEGDKNRADKNEGKNYIKQIRDIEIFIENRPIAHASYAQMYNENIDMHGNIFCLYAAKSSLLNKEKTLQKINFDNNIKDFGAYALLIYHPDKFINRVSRELRRLSKDFAYSPVFYYDENIYQGKLGPFHKSKKFLNQSEFRLWIPNTEEKVFEFFIGDISDISYKIPVSGLNNISAKLL